MIAQYVIVDDSDLQRLRDCGDDIDAELTLLLADEERSADMDKAWAGVHTLLCKRVEGGPKPLCDLVFGGTPVCDTDVGLGPPRVLEPREVLDVYAAIADVDLATMVDDYRTMVLRNPEVYPVLEDDEDIHYLDYCFVQVRRLFAKCAASGERMLVFIG